METIQQKKKKRNPFTWTYEGTFERIKMILMSMDVEEERISESRNFYDDFYFDSLSYLNLLVLIEHYFGIVIEDNLAEKINTVAELQAVVQSKINN
jgi:acyl carrier protein